MAIREATTADATRAIWRGASQSIRSGFHVAAVAGAGSRGSVNRNRAAQASRKAPTGKASPASQAVASHKTTQSALPASATQASHHQAR
jgi:hypothetical protein